MLTTPLRFSACWVSEKVTNNLHLFYMRLTFSRLEVPILTSQLLQRPRISEPSAPCKQLRETCGWQDSQLSYALRTKTSQAMYKQVIWYKLLSTIFKIKNLTQANICPRALSLTTQFLNPISNFSLQNTH